MKKAIALLALVLSGTAMANGTYDGLYQSPVNEKSFLVVQQNGAQVLIGAYYAISAAGVNIVYQNGSTITPPELHVWDAFMGPIQGNSATVYGQVINSMCDATFNVAFTAQTVEATLVAVKPSAAGAAANVPCDKIIPVGYKTGGQRIF